MKTGLQQINGEQYWHQWDRQYYRITAIFEDVDETNNYLEINRHHPRQGVIAEENGKIYVAEYEATKILKSKIKIGEMVLLGNCPGIIVDRDKYSTKLGFLIETGVARHWVRPSPDLTPILGSNVKYGRFTLDGKELATQ